MNENSLPDALISHSGPLHSSVKVSYCICKSVYSKHYLCDYVYRFSLRYVDSRFMHHNPYGSMPCIRLRCAPSLLTDSSFEETLHAACTQPLTM